MARRNKWQSGESRNPQIYRFCPKCAEELEDRLDLETMKDVPQEYCGICGTETEKTKLTYRLSRAEVENMENDPFRDPLREDIEVYAPPKNKMFDEPGAWIMVIRKPSFGPELAKLRVGQIFWAKHDEGSDEYGFRSDGRYMIVVENPWREFKLYPHEYATMDPVTVFEEYQAGELIFHAKKDISVFSGQLYYVRSRGIGMEEALPMVLGSIKENVGWFEPNAKLQRQIDSMFCYTTGLAVLTEENHRRRAESRRRMAEVKGG